MYHVSSHCILRSFSVGIFVVFFSAVCPSGDINVKKLWFIHELTVITHQHIA